MTKLKENIEKRALEFIVRHIGVGATTDGSCEIEDLTNLILSEYREGYLNGAAEMNEEWENLERVTQTPDSLLAEHEEFN